MEKSTEVLPSLEKSWDSIFPDTKYSHGRFYDGTNHAGSNGTGIV